MRRYLSIIHDVAWRNCVESRKMSDTIAFSPTRLRKGSFPDRRVKYCQLSYRASYLISLWKNVAVMYLTADIIENSWSYYESYSVLLPICTANTAVKAVCKYYGSFGIWVKFSLAIE
jgi:hypothetical protein